MKLHRALIACAAVVLGSCRDAAGPDSSCQQTYEFGNTGCVEVTGRVTGLRGQPLSRIDVGAHTIPPSGEAEHFAAAVTDTTGAFSLRFMRMTGVPPKSGPDTISLRVIAADRLHPLLRDTVLVLATFSPVGTIPTPSVANLTLDVP